MNGMVIVGTDTNAGKTTFSLLFLTAFADRFEYWKPVETGDSDSARVRKLVPRATVHPPLASFQEPVAPCLAAAREGKPMPSAAEIIAALPKTEKSLLIETFGGPLSPLTEETLQIALIRDLKLPVVLATPTAVGAVGRTLATARAMADYGVEPEAVALLGEPDPFAVEQIEKRAGLKAFCLTLPEGEWTPQILAQAAAENFESIALRGIDLAELGRVPSTSPTKSGFVFVKESHAKEPVDSQVKEAITHDPRDLIARDRASVWHPYTSLADPADPLPVIAAEREFLHLADGRTLVDAISSWWTILHGHRHPPLMRALSTASEAFDHVLFAGATHPAAIELAELLLASCPWHGGRVFYSDNGSTAVEVALKMAYQFWCHRGEPGRRLFVGFENGYHGDTFGAMAVGRDPLFFGTFEPLLFKAIKVPLSADRLDAALADHRGQVAAVIVEPLVQGAGGMQMHSPAELKALFEAARRHDVLFIADEVMTCCRTGQLWAYREAGISPDLICAAKTLTGGMLPLAATMAAPEIVAAFQSHDRARTFFHGHSFTANPLACAVATANWRILSEESWQREAARIENFWQKHLPPLKERPGVRDLRIRGTIAALELDVPGGYLAEIGPRIRQLAIERGVLLRPLGSVVYAMPPLCSSTDSLQRIAAAMGECLKPVTAGPAGCQV